MTKWYIYLEKNVQNDPKKSNFGEEYFTRRYYRGKLDKKALRKQPSIVKYIGEAELDEDYFITGSVTKHFPITDFNDVVLNYRADLKNGRVSDFTHTVQELLERAKEGILPYISYAEHRVRKPFVTIKGQDGRN